MSPLVHFIISLGMAFCLEPKDSRKRLVILSLGIIGTLPDIDNLLPFGDRALHNTMFLLTVPILLLIFFNVAETNRGMTSSKYQRFMVGVAAVLAGHLLLDLISGGTIIMGISAGSTSVTVPWVPLIEVDTMGVLLASTDLLWISIVAITLLGNVAVKKLYALYEEYDDTEYELPDDGLMDKLKVRLSRRTPVWPVTFFRSRIPGRAKH